MKWFAILFSFKHSASMKIYIKIFIYVTRKHILCEILTLNYRSLDEYALHTRLSLKMLYTAKTD